MLQSTTNHMGTVYAPVNNKSYGNSVCSSQQQIIWEQCMLQSTTNHMGTVYAPVNNKSYGNSVCSSQQQIIWEQCMLQSTTNHMGIVYAPVNNKSYGNSVCSSQQQIIWEQCMIHSAVIIKVQFRNNFDPKYDSVHANHCNTSEPVSKNHICKVYNKLSQKET